MHKIGVTSNEGVYQFISRREKRELKKAMRRDYEDGRGLDLLRDLSRLRGSSKAFWRYHINKVQ